MKTKFYFYLFLLLSFSSKLIAQNKIIGGAENKGLVLKEFNLGNKNTPIKIYAAIIDPSKFKAAIEGFSKENRNGVSPIDIINGATVSVVLGSGFVNSFSPLIPNGFLKIKKKVISDLKKGGYNGIVGVTDNKKLQLMQSNSISSNALAEGFQTGPILVNDGRIIYKSKKRDKANRAFIGINNAGKIIAAVTVDPISLSDLALILSNDPELRCRTAINLSGGGSEALVVKIGNQVFKYGSYDLYESALVAFSN